MVTNKEKYFIPDEFLRRLDSTPEDCDRSEYLDALRVLLGELSETEFLHLLYEINGKAIEIESEYGEDWQCGDNYVAAL